MPVPSAITDLSQTAASNSPSGSDSPTVLDDHHRAAYSFLAQHRDGKGYSLEATVASASTTDIGAVNSFFVQVTGTTTITSFGTTYSGVRIVRFAGALTLTHSSSLVLPGAANITTAAGDFLIAIPNGNPGSGYRVVSYVRNAALPIVAGAVTSSALTMSEARVLGRLSSGSGAIEELTTAQLSSLLSIRAPIFPITATVGSNALTLTLNATVLDFRSSTLGSGTVNTRTVSSPISLTISSGSTLGTVSGQASRIVVLAIDNAGTVELAAVNLAGGVNLDETGLISTTAEGGAGAADSASVIYSTTARSNVPYRVVGYVESTQATAGTWATAPSTIQGAGGQALASMQSLGYGQTYSVVTRTAGVTYYNTTGKPIVLCSNINTTGAAGNTSIQFNGGGPAYVYVNSGAGTGPCASFGSIVIPPGFSYVLTDNSVSARSNFELR